MVQKSQRIPEITSPLLIAMKIELDEMSTSMSGGDKERQIIY